MSAADEIWQAAQMKALAGHLDRTTRRLPGIEIFIDTTVRQDCGCPAGQLCEYAAVPPGQLIDLGGPQPGSGPGTRRPRHTCDGEGAACEPCAQVDRSVRPAMAMLGHGPCTAAWTPGHDPGPWSWSCECAARGNPVPAAHALACPYPGNLRAAAADGSSGRPEKEEKDEPGSAGIPLWDPDRHAALAALAGPLALPESALPSYEAVPPGCCHGCHLPVPDGQERCSYCTRLGELYHARALAAVRRRPAQDALDKAGQDTGELTERRRTCDHGGPRLRFARDGRCARCGRFTPVRRIPAGQRPAARRYPGHPFISLGLGIALFLLGAQAAPWLCVIAVVLVTSGVFRLSRGRR